MSVINVKTENLIKLGYNNLEDWLKDLSHIYIGRDMSVYVKGAIGSKWKNPFSTKQYGRDECIALFEKHLYDSKLINDIDELKGKTLGCWCAPEACHGHFLLKALNENHDDQFHGILATKINEASSNNFIFNGIKPTSSKFIFKNEDFPSL
jgi:hypothetical protein